MRVQTLTFTKDEFPRAASALAWARKHGYRASKVHSMLNHHRVRQESPGKFAVRSFRTIEFKRGIHAIVGCPKRKRV